MLVGRIGSQLATCLHCMLIVFESKLARNDGRRNLPDRGLAIYYGDPTGILLQWPLDACIESCRKRIRLLEK